MYRKGMPLKDFLETINSKPLAKHLFVAYCQRLVSQLSSTTADAAAGDHGQCEQLLSHHSFLALRHAALAGIAAALAAVAVLHCPCCVCCL